MPTTLTLQPTGQVLTVPTQWADVSLSQYVALFAPAADDTRRPAEVLCGLAAGDLDSLAANDVHYLANLLAFAADPSDVEALLPSQGLPDIGSLPYGLWVQVQNHVEANAERPWLAHAPYLLALYRVQLAYGKYSGPKVVACESALLASPVTQSYADAAFFLSSYRQSASGTPPMKPTTTKPATRSWTQVARNWASALARCWASIWRPVAPS